MSFSKGFTECLRPFLPSMRMEGVRRFMTAGASLGIGSINIFLIKL